MWDCGSARFCVFVVAGTGLSMCLAPDCWLVVVLACGILLLCCRRTLVRRRVDPGASRVLGDVSTALLLVSAVALVASERISADSSRVERVEGAAATLRGIVTGFPQPARAGGSVVVRVIELQSRSDRGAAPSESGSDRSSPGFQRAIPTQGLSWRSPNPSTLRKVLIRLKRRVDAVSPGDTLALTGVLRNSSGPRNPGGFSEAGYLFQQGVWYVLDAPGYLRPVLAKPESSRGLMAAYVAPVHSWIRRVINKRMSGQERAFLLALVVGERGEFSEETKAAFRDSGLVHILSVSGLHTALVGLAAVILLRGAGLRESTALAGSAAVVWFYCGLSGFQPPTLRAAFMLSWMIASRLLGRSSELFAPLCSSCAALLLINPRYFWDCGFQLSYVATGSIIASARLAQHVKQAFGMPGWVWKYVVSTGLTTCVAQLGVLPILALQFGSVSIVAVPANLVGIPLASGGLVFAFCSFVLAAALPCAAGYAFDATWLLLRLCNLVAGAAASVPCAALELSRPHVLEVVAFLACFFFTLGLAAQPATPLSARGRTAMFVSVSCLLLLMARFLGFDAASIVTPAGGRHADARPGLERLEVDFLDVGQGDAVVVRSASGSSIVVDAGDTRENWDAGEKVLLPYLRAKGVRSVDAAVVSHFHSDHAGGFLSLIDRGKVKQIFTSGADTTSSFAKLLATACRKNGVAVAHVARDGAIVAGGTPGGEPAFSVRVFHPAGITTADTSSASVNDSSLVCVVECGNVRFVLTGDVGSAVLDALAERLNKAGSGRAKEERERGRPRITVLKAPHHGAAATLSSRFAEVMRPDYVVFSVGKRNRFGHPSAEVLECYERVGARLLRTDVDGCASFKVVAEGAAGLPYGHNAAVLSGPRPDSLFVTTSDPGASHPFIWRAKKWRAERALRALALLSLGSGVLHARNAGPE